MKYILGSVLLLVSLILTGCGGLINPNDNGNPRVYWDYEDDFAIIPGMYTLVEGTSWNGYGMFKCGTHYIGIQNAYSIAVTSTDLGLKTATFEDSRGEKVVVHEGQDIIFTSPCNGAQESIGKLVLVADYHHKRGVWRIVNIDLYDSYITRSFNGEITRFNDNWQTKLERWWGQQKQHWGE